MYALAVLIAGLAGASSAQAGFVPALGSPFPYTAPTTALAVADSDHNGTVDVIAGGALTLRRGAGTGFLQYPIAMGSVGGVEGLAAGDLDGDGRLDYAATVAGPADPRRLVRFRAILGNGYVQDTLLDDAGEAGGLAIGNLDGDGLADIAFVRDEDDPNVTVLLGNAPTVDQEYPSGIDASGGAAPSDIELGDLTGDGLAEIVVAGSGDSAVSVLRNAGDGSFADGELQPTGAAGASPRIALAQLDGDGKLDLLASAPPSSLIPMRGDGAGGLAPLGAIGSGLAANPVSSVTVGDIDGDGLTDILTGGAAGGFAVQLGDGLGGVRGGPGGGVYASGDASGDPYVAEIVAVDMNRDGQTDVVTANRGGSVSVLLNDGTGLLAATPTVADFGALLPATGLFTQTVTLRADRGQLRITRLDRKGSKVFTVQDGDCVGRTLLLGQQCTLSVTFNAPRRARRFEALLSVDANAAAVVLPLTATTRAPLVRGVRLKRRRVVRGTRLDLRYGLSEGALTRVVVERARPGRRVGTECVAPQRGNFKRRRCRLWERVVARARRDLAGRQRMRVATRARPRRIGRKRRPGASYPPGAYRLGVSARDRFRNSSDDQFVRFRILPPRAARRGR